MYNFYISGNTWTTFIKLDTLRKTASLAGGLRLLFLFCRWLHQEDFTHEMQALRSMEQCFLVFMEIEKNPTPGRSPASIF